MTTNTEYHDITTPQGRLVSGNPFKPRTKDGQGNPLTYKSGVKAGQPKNEFSLGIAIPKAQGEAFRQQLHQIATASLPTLFAGGAQPPKFSWKMVDGDQQTPNDNGTIPAQKEGYPGHYVFFFTSDTAPQCYRYGDWDNELMGSGIKCGDYIMIAGSVKAHNDNNRPGLYLNLDKVALVQEGEAIAGAGRTAAQAFAGAPTQHQALPMQPTTQPTPVATQPHTGILNPQGVPQSPGLPSAPQPSAPQPPAPQQLTSGPPKRLYQGQAWDESALLQSGWDQASINTLPIAQ